MSVFQWIHHLAGFLKTGPLKSCLFGALNYSLLLPSWPHYPLKESRNKIACLSWRIFRRGPVNFAFGGSCVGEFTWESHCEWSVRFADTYICLILMFISSWKSRCCGRSRASPHIKTYTRISPDWTELAWFLMTRWVTNYHHKKRLYERLQRLLVCEICT